MPLPQHHVIATAITMIMDLFQPVKNAMNHALIVTMEPSITAYHVIPPI